MNLATSRPQALVVCLIAAAVTALTWSLTIRRIDSERADAVAAAMRANANLAIAYEESVASAFAEADRTMQVAAAEYLVHGPRVGAEIIQWPLNSALVRGWGLFDASGAVVFSVDLGSLGAGERARHLQVHREGGRGLHVGSLEGDPISGQWGATLSRRIDGPQGFAGYVVIQIAPEYFTGFFRRAGLGEDAVVSLAGPDGRAWARQSGTRSSYGVDMTASTLWRELSRRPIGEFVGHDRLDGKVRLYSYRRMGSQPAVAILVGTGRDEALLPVAARARIYYLNASITTACLVLLALALLRFLAKQRSALEALRHTQAQLTRSEAHSRAITASMAAGVFVVDPAGRILEANDAVAAMAGAAREAVRGRDIAAFVAEQDRGKVRATLAELASRPDGYRDAGRPFDGRRVDGSTFEAEVMLSRTEGPDGPLYIGVVRDVTEHNAMVRALTASEARFRATFAQALVGIAHADMQGRLLLVNARLCEILGFEEAELLGRGCPELTHPEDLPATMAMMRTMHAAPGMPTHQVAKRYLRKDGSVVWALLSVTLVRAVGGQPDYFLLMVQDIGELKRAERMKDEFISTVSHELRTPLTSIRGSLGLVIGGVAGALPAKAADLLRIAADNCERLILLVNDILDVEKMESGRLRVELQPVDLRRLVGEVVAANEGMARVCRASLEPVLPGEAVRVMADPARMHQVLANLVSNALKHSPPGQAVTVSLRCDARAARIEVSDRGPGIPVEFRSRIFGRFSQADGSNTRRNGGSGLGLCIAKGLVERMGGTIGYRSEPGAGATFHVELPLATHLPAAVSTEADVES